MSLCSVWSWSAPLSPTGVLSWWSTAANATRTWSTLWEPTPWASNCPPRTSSSAPTSSSRPGSSAHRLQPCRGRQKGRGRAPPLPLPFSFSTVRTSSCLLPLLLLLSWMWRQAPFLSSSSLFPQHFLSSVRGEWLPRWSSSTAASYSVNGLSLFTYTWPLITPEPFPGIFIPHKKVCHGTTQLRLHWQYSTHCRCSLWSRVCVFVCARAIMCLVSCVEIMNHRGAHKKTEKKTERQRDVVQQARQGSVFPPICVQNSIGNTNNINCLWGKKRKTNSMLCYHILFLSWAMLRWIFALAIAQWLLLFQ